MKLSLFFASGAIILFIQTMPVVASEKSCGDSYKIASIPEVKLADSDKLVVNTVEFTVHKPIQEFSQIFFQAPLEKLLPGTDEIPGVVATRVISTTAFGNPGSRRIVCLSDGNTAVEEVLTNDVGSYFKYKVWNYSLPAAEAIEYGKGEFFFKGEGSKTLVKWTYSFKLRENRFPGSLGALGRKLFHLSFIGDYNDFMLKGRQAIITYIESKK